MGIKWGQTLLFSEQKNNKNEDIKSVGSIWTLYKKGRTPLSNGGLSPL